MFSTPVDLNRLIRLVYDSPGHSWQASTPSMFASNSLVRLYQIKAGQHPVILSLSGGKTNFLS